MLKNITLQSRLIGSFIFMGGIVLTVGLVGWQGSNQLSKHISTLNSISLPSIHSLWKINEGQTQVLASEQALVNSQTTPEDRQTVLQEIKAAWLQIEEGLKEYEPIPQTLEEEKFYKNIFLPQWITWKEDHQNFLQLYQKLQSDGLSKADFDTLNQFRAAESRVSSKQFEENVLQLIDMNQRLGVQAGQAADRDVRQTTTWVLIGIILGPTTAIAAGIYFSITIAKPLGAKIAGIVNTIISASSEIAGTVEQQARTATEQSASVSQTTTTMDELSAASQQSAQQAEVAAASAREVLALVEGDGQEHLTNGSSLKEKVGQISTQILQLSEQTSQIGTISAFVSDLANQTNMLALNAAVEAVRAGEHGRGFGVVASEIRKLAEESRKSATNISALVNSIQGATNATVMVADEGTKSVANILAAVKNISVSSQQISLTAKQQSIAIQQVVTAMNAINQGVAQTASGITQTKVETHRLGEAAQKLKTVV